MITRNARWRPRKRSCVSPYAARHEVTTCPSTIRPLVRMLFTYIRPNGSARHASGYELQMNRSGMKRRIAEDRLRLLERERHEPQERHRDQPHRDQQRTVHEHGAAHAPRHSSYVTQRRASRSWSQVTPIKATSSSTDTEAPAPVFRNE